MKNSRKILALVLVLVMMFAVVSAFNFTTSAVNISGGTKLYLIPSANWNQSNARFAAYFFGDGEAWVSMTKVAGESNLYEVTVPAGKNFTNVIFCRMNPDTTANNWNNKWNQTSDLVYNGTSNCYTVKEGTWDKGAGTWSTYGSACAHANVGAAATCTTAQLCLDCGDPIVDALGHSYNTAHLCTRCNEQAPFTVAGTGAHLGTEWDTGNTANDMTYADGVYTKVYTNVAAGSYKFKVVRDHDWGTAYPSADKSFTVATSGSTVTITLTGTTVNVKVEVPHTHSWSDATCTEPQKCECGESQGEALGHTWANCVCSTCEAVLPILGLTDSFDFTTADGLAETLASGKLGYTGTFRDNGDSHQFAADSSIQFVVPANTTVTLTGHSTGYGVFTVYVNGVKHYMSGSLVFTVTEESKVVIVPDETATYSKAYLKGIALAEYVDRTITSDTTITFGSEGNYKDSLVDFSGIQIGDNGGNNSQVKNGSFDLLLKAGTKVVIHGYPGYTSYKLNGGDEITDEYYTYLALEDTVLTVAPVSGNNYFYSIEITLHTGITLVEAKDATCTAAGHGAHYVCDCHEDALTDKGEAPALDHTFVYGKCSVCGAANPDYVPYVNTLVVGDTNKIVVDGDTFNDYNLPIEWVAFVADEKAIYTFVGNNGALVFIFDAELNLLCGGTGSATLEAGTYLICIGNGVVGELNVAVTKTLLHVHEFTDATCTEPSKCECGETQVDALGHSFAFGKCTRCGEEDPDWVEPPVDDGGDDEGGDDTGEAPVAPQNDLFATIIAFLKKVLGYIKRLLGL